MKERTKTFTYQTRFSLDNEKALNAYATVFKMFIFMCVQLPVGKRFYLVNRI